MGRIFRDGEIQLDDDNITNFLRTAHILQRCCCFFLRVFFLFCNYLYSVHSSNMINVTYKYDSKRALFTLLMIQMITQLPKCAVFA